MKEHFIFWWLPLKSYCYESNCVFLKLQNKQNQRKYLLHILSSYLYNYKVFNSVLYQWLIRPTMTQDTHNVAALKERKSLNKRNEKKGKKRKESCWKLWKRGSELKTKKPNQNKHTHKNPPKKQTKPKQNNNTNHTPTNQETY